MIHKISKKATFFPDFPGLSFQNICVNKRSTVNKRDDYLFCSDKNTSHMTNDKSLVSGSDDRADCMA